MKHIPLTELYNPNDKITINSVALCNGQPYKYQLHQADSHKSCKMRIQTTVVLFCIVALLTTGDGQASSSRIVGGYDAELGQFLYQASLKVAGIIHLCGATIISGSYVITGAHCLYSTGPEFVQVVVGTYNLIGGGDSYNVAQYIPHPEYDEVTQANDIGLVQTASIIVFGVNVQPISIGSSDDIVGAGVVARSTGWGSVSVS